MRIARSRRTVAAASWRTEANPGNLVEQGRCIPSRVKRRQHHHICVLSTTDQRLHGSVCPIKAAQMHWNRFRQQHALGLDRITHDLFAGRGRAVDHTPAFRPQNASTAFARLASGTPFICVGRGVFGLCDSPLRGCRHVGVQARTVGPSLRASATPQARCLPRLYLTTRHGRAQRKPLWSAAYYACT